MRSNIPSSEVVFDTFDSNLEKKKIQKGYFLTKYPNPGHFIFVKGPGGNDVKKTKYFKAE